MGKSEADVEEGKAPHLRWEAEDEETGNIPLARSLSRRLSSSSQVSIRSIRGKNIVDPSATLPIHYRSM